MVFLEAFGSLSCYSHLGTLYFPYTDGMLSGTFVVPASVMCCWIQAKHSPVFDLFSSCVLLTRIDCFAFVDCAFVPLEPTGSGEAFALF